MFEQEARLIKKIKKGNQRAFKRLYENYADYALRTAYAITRNNSDASDIVQETFIKIFRNIDSYDTSKSFKPWFYKILINESRRFLTKNSKQAISIESEQALDHLSHSSQRRNSYDDLELAMEQLDENQRTILTLKYLNGFTEKELAEMMDVNVNTIKSRLYKARHRLKAVMGGMKDE